MAEHRRSVDVEASPSALFRYLSDIANLPRSFAEVLSAPPAGSDVVRLTARPPDGSTGDLDAWFRVDDAAQRIEWGAEGPDDDRGWLTVEAVGDHRARVTVGRSTSATGVEQDLDEAVAAIREQFESSGS